MLLQLFSANQSILMLKVFFLGEKIWCFSWMWPFALPVIGTGFKPDKVVRSSSRFSITGEISLSWWDFILFLRISILFRLNHPIKDWEARHADLALHKNMYLQKTLATFTTTHCSWGLGVAACGFMLICPRPNGRQITQLFCFFGLIQLC